MTSSLFSLGAFESLWAYLPSSQDLLEGGVPLVLGGMSVKNCYDYSEEKRILSQAVNSQRKVMAIWKVNLLLVAAAFSFVSNATALAAFIAARVWVCTSSSWVLVTALSWITMIVSSSFRTEILLENTKLELEALDLAESFLELKSGAAHFAQKIVEISFNVSVVFWGVFGLAGHLTQNPLIVDASQAMFRLCCTGFLAVVGLPFYLPNAKPVESSKSLVFLK